MYYITSSHANSVASKNVALFHYTNADYMTERHEATVAQYYTDVTQPDDDYYVITVISYTYDCIIYVMVYIYINGIIINNHLKISYIIY